MDIFKIYFDDNCNLIISLSIWIIIFFALISLIYFLIIRKKMRYDLVKVNIKLGNIGSAEFRPNKTDIQIAHKIWTELVTRKAAIPFDKENDVIEEVYNSWYAIFKKVRELIGEVPAELIRSNKSTKKIVEIATKTLNNGLRPHLTKWQSKFRSWNELNKEEFKDLTPQELQKKYPKYSELIEDLVKVNELLIQYAEELKKIIEK
ncbi:MAG: hypothetical protein COA67_02065 [Lutibacter sp.]|nr:MAG: hypothetical protein COA67_02065 [Lutibacter sp.]